MKRIGLLGLSGTGKTVYLTMVNNALSKGVTFISGCELKIYSDANQNNELSYNYKSMTHERYWPEATMWLGHYNFMSCLPLSNQYMPFAIMDYPGGWLMDFDYKDGMLEEFNKCDAIIVLVGADMLRKFFNGNLSKFPFFEYIRYFMQKMIIKRKNYGYCMPSIMFTISKSDLLPNIIESRNADDFIREHFFPFFSAETNIMSGIHHMSVLNNLGVEGAPYCNIAIPILFSLFGKILLQNDDTLTNSDFLIKHAILQDAKIYYNGSRI